MASSQLSALSAVTPTLDDLIYVVDDPGGTPTSKKATLTQIKALVGGAATTSQGAYAALPGTCAVGDLYFFTDSVYPVARCNATNVWTLFLDGKIAVPPGVVSGWTGVNVGANWTATDAGGSINIAITTNASLNWRVLAKAQPSTPYTVTYACRAQLLGASATTVGAYFYDSTKLMGIELMTPSGLAVTLRVQKATNVTTASTTPFSLTNFGAVPQFPGLIYFRLSNDGATLDFLWSLDGIVFTSVYTEAVGTFITPTQYAFGGVNQSGSSPVTLSLQSVVLA